jgi:hypothetical protein
MWGDSKIVGNAEQRVRAILLLAYEGLKPSEIALLRGSDVDAADLGNSPLSITEIPQLIAGVGCR